MGVLKNDVGRPSNKTIMIRRILKMLLLVLFMVVCYFGGYMLGKNLFHEKDNNKDSKKVVEKEKFDINKVTSKTTENYDEYYNTNAIDVYVYGNKIDLSNYFTDKIDSITPIDDVALLELHNEFNILLLVNKKGEILYDFELDNGYFYCSDNLYSNECYSYKVDNNTIRYMVANLGQDNYTACVTNNDKKVLIEYEITYKDGKLSQPKEISSMIGKEYVQKHNINCSE